MLVLKYGIECDLLQEGNVRIVDGEIAITSEAFLRELEKCMGVLLDHIILVPHVDLDGPAILAQYTLWGEPDEFACLDVTTSQAESVAFNVAL